MPVFNTPQHKVLAVVEQQIVAALSQTTAGTINRLFPAEVTIGVRLDPDVISLGKLAEPGSDNLASVVSRKGALVVDHHVVTNVDPVVLIPDTRRDQVVAIVQCGHVALSYCSMVMACARARDLS